MSEFVLWTGFSGILPYLPIFLKDEGHSSVMMIGFITAAFYLGTLIFSSPFGWLSDLVGRKPMMIAGMALMAVTCFLFTLSTNPRWFLLFRLLEGTSAAAGGVMFAFIADVSVPGQRSRALGLVMSAQFAGRHPRPGGQRGALSRRRRGPPRLLRHLLLRGGAGGGYYRRHDLS